MHLAMNIRSRRVACAVPNLLIDLNFCFLVADSTEITLKDMITRDDDFTRLAACHLQSIEVDLIHRAEWFSGLIGNDTQLDLWDGVTRAQTCAAAREGACRIVPCVG